MEKEIADLEKEHPSFAFALVCGCGLFYMFVALYLVCDEFFVPSLDCISARLGLSADVAGATFMAAGGSAPEFFTSLIGAVGSPEPSNVGIAAIVGSAVFNVLAVIGACGLCSKEPLQLTAYPLARDSLFYLVDLLVIVWAFGDGAITMMEAGLLFFLYIIYCIFMAYSSRVEQSIKAWQAQRKGNTDFDRLDANRDDRISMDEAKKDKDFYDKFALIDENQDGTVTRAELRRFLKAQRLHQLSTSSEGEEEGPQEPMSLAPPTGGGAGAWAWYVFTFPLALVLVLTVPDVRRKGCWEKLYVPGFILSILWIAIFSWLMVHFTEVVGAYTGISKTLLALTLLAWGTSVPDLLTSVLVTIQGHGDMAVSSSIGSNIFDVTVGLPVPWMIYLGLKFASAKEGAPSPVYAVGKDGLAQNILMLVGMVAFTILSILINGWILNRCLGIMMIVLWVIFTAYSIWSVMKGEGAA